MLRSYYRDPDKKKDLDLIYTEIREIKSGEQAYNLVKKYVPEWIITECLDYADEYEKYKENWRKVFTRTMQGKKRVLIVDKIVFEDKHKEYTVLQMFCEILTRAGFNIRRKEEFIPCKVCGLAIENKGLSKIVQGYTFQYNGMCRKCSKENGEENKEERNNDDSE